MGVLSDQFTPIPTSRRQHSSQGIHQPPPPITPHPHTYVHTPIAHLSPTHTRTPPTRDNTRNREPYEIGGRECYLYQQVCVRSHVTHVDTRPTSNLFPPLDGMRVAVARSTGVGRRRVEEKKGKNEKRTKSDIGRPRTPQNHQYYIIRYRNTNTATHPPIHPFGHPRFHLPIRTTPRMYRTYHILLFTVKFIHAYASRHVGGWGVIY